MSVKEQYNLTATTATTEHVLPEVTFWSKWPHWPLVHHTDWHNWQLRPEVKSKLRLRHKAIRWRNSIAWRSCISTQEMFSGTWKHYECVKVVKFKLFITSKMWNFLKSFDFEIVKRLHFASLFFVFPDELVQFAASSLSSTLCALRLCWLCTLCVWQHYSDLWQLMKFITQNQL